MNYILRRSNSVTEQLIVEYLQNGILIRLNIVESTNDDDIPQYDYDEFWFSSDSNIEYIDSTLINESFSVLTEEYKNMIN